MPNWAGGVLTAKGRALQAKVEAGQTLELTKMKLGSGTPEPEEIDNLIDLKQPQNIMGVSSKTVENNICEVTSVILTSNIDTPFYAREWGLFANDPDEGEILYMYTTDPNPDYIPDKNSALVISASYALNIAVLNVDNIVANIDPEGLITAGILEEELKKYLPLSGGTMKGDINASGYNITATKFIGNLQGKADSATNADLATKANQDSQGQTINTTYIKSITASNATLTVTKGNGTTSTVTINNVENSKKATQDGSGNTITTHYLSRNQSTQNDMNACTVEGIYRFSGTLKNGWTSDSWGTLLVFNNQYNGSSGVSGTYLVQIALPTDGRMWTRQRVNTGAWTSWNKLANTTDCTDTLKKVYPVGSIYMSTVSTNPATLFGFGTWEQIQGRFLLGVSGSYAVGTTGGAETVTLTTAQLPSHNHSGSTGSAGNHNHSASSSNVNISGTFGTGNTTPNILYKGDTSGCFYNTGSTGNDGTNQSHYTQDDRTQKIGINNTHSHTITINNNGTHTHTVSIGNTGSGQAHTNMPPYVAVYIWKRKA